MPFSLRVVAASSYWGARFLQCPHPGCQFKPFHLQLTRSEELDESELLTGDLVLEVVGGEVDDV